MIEEMGEKVKEVAINENGLRVEFKLIFLRFDQMKSEWWCMQIKLHITKWRK